jgi:hypothetical protein
VLDVVQLEPLEELGGLYLEAVFADDLLEECGLGLQSLLESSEEHAEQVGVRVSPLFLMLVFDLLYLARLTSFSRLICKHLFYLIRLLPPRCRGQLRGVFRGRHQKLRGAELGLEINERKCGFWSVWVHVGHCGIEEALRKHLEMRIVEELFHGVRCLKGKHFLGFWCEF